MTEFGQLASNTEQLVNTINPPEQNRLYNLYTQTITKNDKFMTKYRK